MAAQARYRLSICFSTTTMRYWCPVQGANIGVLAGLRKTRRLTRPTIVAGPGEELLGEFSPVAPFCVVHHLLYASSPLHHQYVVLRPLCQLCGLCTEIAFSALSAHQGLLSRKLISPYTASLVTRSPDTPCLLSPYPIPVLIMLATIDQVVDQSFDYIIVGMSSRCQS
jgi:hypothetical protein